jgi:hypothetical protein
MTSNPKSDARLPRPEDILVVESLDWETRLEDFDRLCELVIESFAERDHLVQKRLFRILPEEEFRRQVRNFAAAFAKRWSRTEPP